ncbi:MAG: hypothetical protein A2020_12640 [Lentisphaerae bacterium GWF2_45_14]|nr:MAG: hypothetical protein A2020_12640 [Lentisphaerae bacterium GWF2_45_14]
MNEKEANNKIVGKLDFHEKRFDDGTLCKLEMYRKYLRTWLPTFLNNQHVDIIQIFDFFAGPGYDSEDNPGSPIIASEEIRAALDYNKLRRSVEIKLFLNELDIDKYNLLRDNAKIIRETNPEITVITENKKFIDIFEQAFPLMEQPRIANFLFLDQFGISEIKKDIFTRIINLNRTDFIFFVSASIINRVKGHPDIIKHIPLISEDNWRRMTGNNVNRILSDAYQQWIPAERKYFLGNFAIKKGANVYGLIFGSGHPLGIDKFLQVAWEMGGDANFDIDGDNIDENQLYFPALSITPKKITEFEQDLTSEIMGKLLLTNKDIYFFTLKRGMLPKHSRDLLTSLKKTGKLPKQKLNISYDAWKKPEIQQIIYNKEDNL